MYGNGNSYDSSAIFQAAAAAARRTEFVQSATEMVSKKQGETINTRMMSAIERFQIGQAVIQASNLPDEQREMAETVNHNVFAGDMNAMPELDNAFRAALSRALMQTNLPDEIWAGEMLPPGVQEPRGQIGFQPPVAISSRVLSGPARIAASAGVSSDEYDQMQRCLRRGSWAHQKLGDLPLYNRAKGLGIGIDHDWADPAAGDAWMTR